MSKFDSLFGCVGDYESSPGLEQEINLSSWAVQNARLTFSVGVPYKGKPRPNKATVPQALPSLPFDSCLDSPRGKEFSPSWRSPEEKTYRTPEDQGFAYPWSLGFSDAELCDFEAQAALRAPCEEMSGKSCLLDRIGSEIEQSSSESEILNEPFGGAMSLACSGVDDRPSEGLRETCSENNGDGDWEGIIRLVHEVTSRFATEPKCASNIGTEQVEQKIDPKKIDTSRFGTEQRCAGGTGIGTEQDQQQIDPKKIEKIGDQPKTEGVPPAQSSTNLEATIKGHTCGISADEIIKSLSAIQRNMEFIKDAVPKIASRRQNFTVLVRKQCAAAVGAVKLISQLADAAAGIIPEIERQVGAAPSDKSQCASSSDIKQEDSPVSLVRREGDVGEYSAGMEKLIPTLAAVSVSPASGVSGPAPQESDGAVLRGNNLESTGASEFGRDEKECASSLVADLLGPCDRITGAGGFATPTCSPSPFGWVNDLEEAIKAGGYPQSRSEDNLRFENPDDAARSGSDEEPNLESTSRPGAAHDESDEGDTRGSDQLPPGSFTLMEIDDLEILTEQTHYCNVCSKGFKRDANLRMHMRSHGGKYKSSTALIRLERAPKVVQEMVGGKPTRYSCPYVGCNRNMKHPKFQALKTMLCLKNHYRRSHCAKTLKCSICKSKQFSVVADLKTHEKHCGSDKWACSCGTTFSRKEKLYGHVSLFVGHVPVDASVAANAPAPEVGASQLCSLAAQNEAVSLWQNW